MSYVVTFEGMWESFYGDIRGFEFKSLGEDDNAEKVKVEIPDTLVKHLGNPSGDDLASISARVVEIYLQGSLPVDVFSSYDYVTIRLSIHWYPGHPGEPERIETFSQFMVKPIPE